MVKIPSLPDRDPLLEAIDAEMERRADTEPRSYLGASAIGHACERKLWLDFHWASKRSIPAKGLRAIDDGHRGEEVIAERIRMVPGVKLVTHVDGKQIGFHDIGGHFRGNADGIIEGLPQAPATRHVWECKIANEKKFEKLRALKAQIGEKQALRKWDPIYYAQAQIYMHYLGCARHYLTVGSPGARDLVSCRTDYDAVDALRLIEKARRVIDATQPPARISEDPSWYECKFCDHHQICHGQPSGNIPTSARINCRTCLHSTPVSGGWECARGADIDLYQRSGCSQHLLIPALVAGEQIDASETWVEYRLRDGSIWRNAYGKQGS